MNPVSIFLFLISAIFALGSAVPGKEVYYMSLAHYVILGAILVEIGCIHDLWKERKS